MNKQLLPRWIDIGLLPLINLLAALVVSGIIIAIISYFLLRPLVSTYQKKRDSLKAERLKKKLMRRKNEIR